MVRYLRNTLMAKIAGEASELLQVSADERKRAARTAMLFSEEDLTRFLQIMLRTFDDLGYRQEQRFHFELGLLKLVHAQRLLPLEQMLSPLAPSAPKSLAAPPLAVPVAPRPAVRAAEPAAFSSPFERDTRRKEPTAEASAPKAVSTMGKTEGALALEAEPVRAEAIYAEPIRSEAIHAVPLHAPVLTAPVLTAPPDVDAVKQAIVQALVDAEQTSAAQLLSDAAWSQAEREWRVEVGVGEQMLSVAINADARKLAERLLRERGWMPAKIAFIATTAARTTKPASLPLPAGGVAQLANENTLVQKARQLFDADIRDVVDLRDRRS
jgi:DNA polymerase-3 subunit gamma/tau